MGRDFRDKRYKRYVRVGKRTIKDGEAAVIWNINGASREVVGPRLVRLFYSNVNFLTRHVATRDEYLVVNNRDGHTEHLLGPRSMFENPVRHLSIQVVPCLYLESVAHKLVVYTENSRQRAVTAQGDGIEFVEKSGNEGIEQSIVSGPRKFMPEVNQTVHKFKWELGANTFDILDTSEKQWTQAVNLMSADSIRMTATLVFSVACESVDKMLLSKDPFAELSNALNADLSAYGSKLTWDETRKIFREDVCRQETLPQFYTRAGAIGMKVQNVLLKSLVADKKILETIQAKLDAETKFARDRTLALEKQKMEVSQMEQKQKMEKTKLEAQNQLIESQQQLAKKEKEHALQMAKDENDAQAYERERRNKETLGFLKEMKTMGVNLDTFLTANTLSQNKQSIVIGTPAMAQLRGQITPSEPTIQIVK